ncbi:Wzz/FepE/Etk N-terminal domain-containing protein [Streptomyces sp. NPDC001717]|uniref:Wzz/FepE/Etk N-terminal domain-containing protein n=1 Tax=Streptomyces sp. NPDC001717 TaxID=3364604 RepID=UPI0036BDEAC4
MDLAEIWRVMRRRWYVLIPGLVITAVLAAAVHFLVPVEYQSQSTVTLLNSKKATEAFDGNPFLSTQTSLTGMADGLARNLNSDGAVADLKALGLTGKHEAKIADNALGPFMWLTVTGTDRAAVLESDEILTKYAQKRLDEFQTQQTVRPEAMIRMATIVPPQEPQAQTKSRIQFLVMAGALGFVLSLVATFFVEARKRRGPGKHRPDPAEDQGEGPEARAPEPEERPAAPAPARAPAPVPAPVSRTEEPAVERTLGIRRPPSWARSDADGPAAAQPEAPQSVMAAPTTAEPLDEESTHGHRPHPGQ